MAEHRWGDAPLLVYLPLLRKQALGTSAMLRQVWIQVALVALLCTAQVTPIHADGLLYRFKRILPFTVDNVGRKPHTESDKCLEELARNLDWLEHQLNRYGTVVAKTPDVWGEARMTAHRQEFEDVLKRELYLFQKNQINGAEYVSDQAFLAFALSMGKNVQGAGATPPPITINSQSTPPEAIKVGSDGSIQINQGFSEPGKIFGFSEAQMVLGEQITIEQTEILDQLARYVNHLHQLRRINEGDDTADAPGYAMNLVRIPVSLLPGDITREGYGAEITVTAEPYFGPELLPVAFRDFVINDLVDQLAIPMTRFLNSDPREIRELMILLDRQDEARRKINELNENSPPGKEPFGPIVPLLPVTVIGEIHANFQFFTINDAFQLVWTDILIEEANWQILVRELDIITQTIREIDKDKIDVEEIAGMTREIVLASGSLDSTGKLTPGFASATQKLMSWGEDAQIPPDRINNTFAAYLDGLKSSANAIKAIEELRDVFRDEVFESLRRDIAAVHVPSSVVRRSTLPFPPTQLIANYGLRELGDVVRVAHKAFQKDLLNREVVHVTDVQAFLREELAAAYEMMGTDRMRHEWVRAAMEVPEDSLNEMIRSRKIDKVDELRAEFLRRCKNDGDDFRTRCTAVLAWCVYVESLLLNERLLQDMRETAGNRPGFPHLPAGLPLYGPTPAEEGRIAFAEYVKARWPLKVFAIDPVVTEQNIADVRSIYRQMQMAVAMGYAQGDVSTSAALQAMRKLQRDRATFDLNRTAVGFGHGDDTFGWRFYPRFQTPPVEGNLTVLARDLVLGGPTDEQLEHKRQIEPGMRECMAVVLMPSFVPHVTFHTRGRWFKLTRPSKSGDSITETVEYSRAIKQMETCAYQCVQSAHLYRDGEVERLLKRVHQLDRQLALQTLECQVPTENTHGGFEILSAGTRELSPELTGWYGSPGYDPARGCKLFLSGNNFNVTTTSLVVGNRDIGVKLLSRQIMEVHLPPGLAVMRDHKFDEAESRHYMGYVDAQVATPYGVSGHLLIPVVRGSNPPSAMVLQGSRITVLANATKASGGNYDVEIKGPAFLPTELFFVDVPTNVGLADAMTQGFQVRLYHGETYLGETTMMGKKSFGGYRVDADLAFFVKGGAVADSLKKYAEWYWNTQGADPTLRIKAIADYKRSETQLIPIKGAFEIELRTNE